MNIDWHKVISKTLAIKHSIYRGVVLWQARDGIRIILGDREYTFLNEAEARAFIDAAFSTIIVPEEP